jgi:hypothetical protein
MTWTCEVHHRLPDVVAVEEGFCVPDEGEEGGKLGVEEVRDVAVGDEEEVAGAICSKPNSGHLVVSSEHLPGNFEHLNMLHEITEPVRSLQKAPGELVGVAILCLREVGSRPLMNWESSSGFIATGRPMEENGIRRSERDNAPWMINHHRVVRCTLSSVRRSPRLPASLDAAV